MKKIILIATIIILIILVIGAFSFYFISKNVPREFIEYALQGDFSGPGGCSGPDCEEVCRENPEICQKWCVENPEICDKIMGGGSIFGRDSVKTIEPPNTIINYVKTMNFNSGQFTPQDIVKAKELGANMVTFWPPKIIQDDEINFYPNAEGMSNLINTAYENGLHVELRSSFGSQEVVKDYEKFRINAINHVAEYAKYAEQRKIYRIVPFGEIDNHMFDHCDKITELSADLLKEMRKHYSGKIGVGIVGSWRDCGYTFNGYDYLTVSAYPQLQTGMDVWLTEEPEINLISTVEWARSVADRSNIDFLHIGETGVINPEDIRSSDFDTVVVSKEKEAEFFDKMFSLIGNKVNGLSVFYNSRVDFMTINGDPAEEVVKEWYEKIE